MTTKELMAIVDTRLKCESDNPTSKSFLIYISEAMKRLQAYEDKDPEIQKARLTQVLDELDEEL